MGPNAGLSNAIGMQINEKLGSEKASEFIEFAASRWADHHPFLIQPHDLDARLKTVVFNELTWTIPRNTYWSHLHRMALGYHAFMLRKYSLPGFCEVKEGDTVLDCGSFIGGFASACAGRADRVIAVEPSPVNSAAAAANLARSSNVTLARCALWNACTVLPFHISETAIDDGILDPDHGAPVETVEVEAITIAELARRHGIDRFDFMKVEAEGVELEILTGEGGLDCDRIAIDCAPERGGASPDAEVMALLNAHGFETQKRGIVVFGRRTG
ncbi:FkbM family methyltransferase [Nitratireductor sp. ZSWI3]|uniref:FkbM family methyltransferase n=1 Tax=Nitratireductor sp. ZSWI3 TaxID=2966359 RepID=UPI00215050D6|nr:FkbM family methyltransferase [Nitratireductor sp. ZSWI3]MCR4268817.1 FkbM family methyltransferase [Nitratireductor sp. ZSWI3]